MRLLVTGGAGFIGTNLIRQLIGRPEIQLLVNLDALTYAGHLLNLEDLAGHPHYRFERVDLRDKEAVARTVREHRITRVIHLAAETHVDRSIHGPDAFIHSNIVGTFHLLEACRQLWTGDFDQTLFLHVSTDEVYGSLGPSGLFTEQSSYAPNSPYSASKAASDFLVRAYHQTYGLPAVISNSCNNFGPWQHPEKLIPMTIRSVLERRPIPVYGDGLNVREWLYVTDYADALWHILTRGRVGQTYSVSARNAWPNLRLVERICDLLDELVPASGGNSRQLIQFVPDRLGHDRRYALDPSKVEREFGWRPGHSFEDGLRKTLRWFLDHQDWVRAVS